MPWSRRDFLSSALGVLGAAGSSGLARLYGPSVAAAAPSAPTGAAPAADRVLAAAVDAMLPAGGAGPSAEQAGVAAHLSAVAADPNFAALHGLWRRGSAALDQLAQQRGGRGFAALDESQRCALLRECLGSPAGSALSPVVLSLLEFSLEGYFGAPHHGGNRDRVVWRAYGFDAAMGGAAGTHRHAAPRSDRDDGRDVDAIARRQWDAIVIGSGAGGAALAWRLASRGLAVLVLEKGHRIAPNDWHDEIAVTRRNLFVPYVKDEPHVVVAAGRAPERRRDGWTACCVGGGTVHMSAMLLRMQPADFTPDGGGAAWPFGYQTLQPYYDLIETTLGVSGDRTANPFEAPARALPLPPISAHPAAQRLSDAARVLGLHPYPTPRGILSRPYRGRGGCAYCPFCASYACEAEAKAAADVTLLRMAEASGATVWPGARAAALRSAAGRVEGVDVIDAAGTRRALRASLVVLAAGAMESARLALLSTTPSAPRGVGNQRDQVGRHVTGSYNAGLSGRFAYPGELFAPAADAQPFVNLALQDLYAGPARRPGLGTVMIDRRPLSPIDHAVGIAMRAVESGAPLLGAPLKDALCHRMAHSRAVVVEAFLPIRPHAERRISLDPHITDAWQLPAARLAQARYADDGSRGAAVVELGEQVLRAAGAADVDSRIELDETPFLVSGSMRMGRSAADSACDPDGRVHGFDNLYVCDSGALPGMGGVPPTLTIMANAARIADRIRHG